MNAIDIAKKQKRLKRLLFASTSEVYAGTLRYHGLEFPTTEETPLTVSDLRHPRTSHMLSKIYGEALLRQSNLPYTIFRPHNFYGPRMGMSHRFLSFSEKHIMMRIMASYKCFLLTTKELFVTSMMLLK